MGKSSDTSPGNGEKKVPEASKALDAKSADAASDTPKPQIGDAAPPPSATADNDLPIVEAPKLDGSEVTGPAGDETPKLQASASAEPTAAVAAIEAPDKAAGDTIAATTQARSWRFMQLAATIALAAAFGSFVGSLTASGIIGRAAEPAAAPNTHTADAGGVAQAMKSQLTELSALKSTLDGATRGVNAEFAKITDRLDRVERLAVDPSVKLAHIADTVDRLDKRSAAAPETTGSITAAPPQASETKLADRILPGWTVRDVHGGRALIEGPYGGVFVVGAGSFLPRLGAVETVKRQDGQWIVVTSSGVIRSGR
jgi:hypothetical protein